MRCRCQSFSRDKEILDFLTLAIHSLAVMHWFLAVATGRDARRDALLGQYLADFVSILPLIPITVAVGGRSLSNTSAVTALPLTQVESQATTFAVADHRELLNHAPLGTTNQTGGPPY